MILLDLDNIFDNDRVAGSITLEPATGVLTVDDVPAEWRDFLRERTAIMQDDGRVPYDVAELLAIADTIKVAANWHLYPRF